MASFGVDDPSFLPSFLPSLYLGASERVRLVDKADKISCTPISKRTEGGTTNQRTDGREAADGRRFRDTKDDLSTVSPPPSPPPPPILIPAASDSQWPFRSSTVCSLDGVAMHPPNRPSIGPRGLGFSGLSRSKEGCNYPSVCRNVA